MEGKTWSEYRLRPAKPFILPDAFPVSVNKQANSSDEPYASREKDLSMTVNAIERTKPSIFDGRRCIKRKTRRNESSGHATQIVARNCSLSRIIPQVQIAARVVAKVKSCSFRSITLIIMGIWIEQKEAWGNFYRQLIRKGFPDKHLQVLCANCNVGRSRGRPCPHRLRPARKIELPPAFRVESSNRLF